LLSKGGCSFTPGGDVICVTKDKKVYYCTKVKTTYLCDLQVAKTGIPPALSDALDAAIQDTQGYLAIPSKYNKLIVSLRTCYAKEYSLDKEQTSYNDSLDALRLSLRGYQIE
jgi:hypothetical protein